jgi:cardiolipin synthase
MAKFTATSGQTVVTLLIQILAMFALVGCAGVASQKTQKPDHSRKLDSSELSPDAPVQKISAVTRRIFGAVQFTQNMVRTVVVDPFVRPYSTLAAGSSVILKTGGGMLRRTLVSTFQMPALNGPLPPIGNAGPMDPDAWERKLDSILGSKASRGEVNFLIDGDEFFPRLTAAIEGSQKTVDVRTYIFDNDDVSVKIADLLRRRSADVDVRVLLDGVGTLLGTQVDSATMPADFQPPLSMTAYLETGSRVRVRTHSNPFMTGDHVKSTIIDGERAFVGGMNIGREYRYEWHDMMMEVTGPIVAGLERDSDKAWGKAGFFGDLGLLGRVLKPRRTTQAATGYPIRALYTLPHDSQIYNAQLAAIRQARSHIFIENAYFSDDVIMYELARARRRGVDVRVIIPAVGNHPMMNLSNGVAINTMLEHGIRVYLYPGMSHIKAAVFDGWACVGSANFDVMSLRINREMNLATADPETVHDLTERLFLVDFNVSQEITEATPVGLRHNLAELLADTFL